MVSSKSAKPTADFWNYSLVLGHCIFSLYSMLIVCRFIGWTPHSAPTSYVTYCHWEQPIDHLDSSMRRGVLKEQFKNQGAAPISRSVNVTVGNNGTVQLQPENFQQPPIDHFEYKQDERNREGKIQKPGCSNCQLIKKNQFWGNNSELGSSNHTDRKK